MACYAYSVLIRWFSSVYSGAGSRTSSDLMAKQDVSTRAPNGASRAVGTHHGPTRIRLQATPSEGRYSWHYDTLSSPHLPPPALALRDVSGPPGAVGGWAPPPLPPGPQDLPRDYGPDGAAGGLSRSTPRRADHATTGAGRRPGLGARLLATSDEARAGWFVNGQSERFFLSLVNPLDLGPSIFKPSHRNGSFFESSVTL